LSTSPFWAPLELCTNPKALFLGLSNTVRLGALLGASRAPVSAMLNGKAAESKIYSFELF